MGFGLSQSDGFRMRAEDRRLSRLFRGEVGISSESGRLAGLSRQLHMLRRVLTHRLFN